MNTPSASASLPCAHPGLAEPSPLARQLSHAGLIPFVGGALFVTLLVGRLEPQAFSFVVNAMSSYAALVVSFLGGIPWGLTMLGQSHHQPATPEQQRSLTWGIAYALSAWIALLMPPHAGLAALGGLLVGCYAVDRKRYAALGASGWLKLRFRLTVVSSLSCFMAAAQL